MEATALGDGVVVGEAASIERSVVMNGARIGKGAEVGLSIVGDAVVEAGAILTDFTIVGAGGVVAPGSRLSAAKVAPAEGSAGVRALVTGGAGFIGSTLVDRLLAEHLRVDVIDDLSTGQLGNLNDARSQPDRRFSFHRLDVSSPAVSEVIVDERPDVIFHLAAQADVRVSVSRPVFDATVNILGTLNVCEGAIAPSRSR